MPGSIASDCGGPLPLSPEGRALLAVLGPSRDLFARRLIRDVPAITDHDMNALTISIFLQILLVRTGQVCGFMEQDTLAALAASGGIAKRLGRACQDAGVDPVIFFENGPEGSRSCPAIPDEPLRQIITDINRPEIPVPLMQLPLEDLAAVLDHFLGYRLQIGEGYRVVTTGKSSLLYTGMVDVPPHEVIATLVEQVVRGRGRDSRTRILDPACGAGLILQGVFRALVQQRKDREGRVLTADELRETLSMSVFGIDIDPESVTAARFVLLLALVEECGKAGAGPLPPGQLAKACTALPATIRCGNALIAPDYFVGKPVFPFNAEERKRVNAFDWQTAFPAVIREGGFDGIAGAPPPYRPFAVKAREEYFQTHYDAYAPSAGLYGYFIERAFSLIRPGGTVAFLVPGTFLRSGAARPLRRLLLGRQIRRIASTGHTRMLPEGDTMMYLLALENRPAKEPFTVSLALSPARHDFQLDQRSLDDGGWRLEDTRAAGILSKIRGQGTLLEAYVMGEMGTGTHRLRDNPLVVDRETRNRLTKRMWWARRFFLPLLVPADIRWYMPRTPSQYIIAETNPRKIRKCRPLVEYLEQAGFAAALSHDNELPDEPEPLHGIGSDPALSERPLRKIVFPEFQQSPVFSLDRAGKYAIADSLCAITRDDPYLAAILNSALGRFIVMHICPSTDRGYHVSPAAIGKFPVVVPDFDQFSDKKRYEKIVVLVSRIISLNEYLVRTRTDQECRLVQQEIDATNVQIDALVYDLYGLNTEEIEVIEASATV